MARLDEQISMTRKRYNSVRFSQAEDRYEQTMFVQKEECKQLDLIELGLSILTK